MKGTKTLYLYKSWWHCYECRGEAVRILFQFVHAPDCPTIKLAENKIFDEMSNKGLFEVMCGGGVLEVTENARVKAARAWLRRYPRVGPKLLSWQVQAHLLALYIVKTEAGESPARE